jgi:2'-hydroxyisoflavone reductase
MRTDRRGFLKTTLAAGGALGLGLRTPGLAGTEPGTAESREGGAPPTAPRHLDILILGGTGFIGPHLVRYALERGHSVSIFTRGRTKPDLFPEAFEHVERLIGDRAGDLSALKNRRWDAVIDDSGQKVKWTHDSAQLLKDAVGTYLYVSSTGVFYPYRTVEIGEDGPIALVDPTNGKSEDYAYGVMKANSEIEARKAFGERALIIRPGYIVGPGDRSDRFTYWPVRVERGGEILVPGKQGDFVQYVDVRDLTEWMIRLLEEGKGGVFNATGPASHLTMAEFVYGVRATTSAELSWTWVDDYDFLTAQNLTWAIPWVIPTGDNLGSQRIDCRRARAAGLAFRPLATTVTDTLTWWHSDAVSPAWRSKPHFVLTPEREKEILKAWKARSG